MSEEGLESLDKNESKMDEGLEVCQNSSIDDLMRRLDIFKVVHTERGTVEFIVNDHRHGVPKGTVELEKHASEYKKKMEVDMKKKLEEASRQHANTLEKMIAELEETRLQIEDAKRNAKKMEAQRIEDSRRHSKEMEAKENQKRAEIKKLNARVEKEKMEKLKAMTEVKQLKQEALRDQSARAVAATESERVESKATRAMDALTKARKGSEELRTQLGAAKDQLKMEIAKRENVVKLHKNTKQAFATSLKEQDEHRVIQEGIAENQEGEIARLTKVMEDIAMEEENRRRIVVESLRAVSDDVDETAEDLRVVTDYERRREEAETAQKRCADIMSKDIQSILAQIVEDHGGKDDADFNEILKKTLKAQGVDYLYEHLER